MTKQELIKAFKNEKGLSQKEATSVVDLFFKEMTDTFKDKDLNFKTNAEDKT